MIKRRKAKAIKIGAILIGDNHPVAIQSMVKVKTADGNAVIRQIRALEASGCEIVRLAIKDQADAEALKKIKRSIQLPLVADIHFNAKLALKAIEYGIDKIRLNPGNIYKAAQVREIAQAAKRNRIPIRVGLNSGSLPRRTSQVSRRRPLVDTMVKSALDYIKILENTGFYDIVISLKASNIPDTVAAYRKMAILCDYPFHLGLTATGLPQCGLIKSSIAIGALLLDGIGDTIRISLTDKPQAEARAAKGILEALGLRSFGPEIISCPTCGRCEVDLVKIVKKLEKELLQSTVHSPQSTACDRRPLTVDRGLKIAIMGCIVNGPGEAKEADIGVAFGKNKAVIFKKAKILKTIASGQVAGYLAREIKNNG